MYLYFSADFVYFCHLSAERNKKINKLTTIILPSEVTMATVPEPHRVKETFSGQKHEINVNNSHENNKIRCLNTQLTRNYISTLQQRSYTAARW